MGEFIYFTEEQKERANAVPIADILRREREEVIRSGNEWRWKRHQSVTFRGSSWYRHSQQVGSHAIDFMQEFFGMTYPEAVTYLLDGETGEVMQGVSNRQTDGINQKVGKKKHMEKREEKIDNQASVLRVCVGEEMKCMRIWANEVKSGDPENLEARAAAFFWKNLFADIIGFTRDREGISPNNLLNYGYAILRAIVARALVASGLLPTLGIHHHNRYNAYCLADDVMEPYRPYVDELVFSLVKLYGIR